jgi:cell pole-organizing protein PopZ
MSSANSKVQEPSMEEILASIRRIIADDQEVLRSASGSRNGSSSLNNVLDLAERQGPAMSPLSREPETQRSAEAFASVLSRHALTDDPFAAESHHDEPRDDDLQLTAYDDEPAVEGYHDGAAGQVPQTPFSDPGRDDTLLSSAVNASVSDAFTRLGSTIMPARPQTLEDLMKDLLRPILKAWLDENLPGLVERLVQAEIERISRRR